MTRGEMREHLGNMVAATVEPDVNSRYKSSPQRRRGASASLRNVDRTRSCRGFGTSPTSVLPRLR